MNNLVLLPLYCFMVIQIITFYYEEVTNGLINKKNGIQVFFILLSTNENGLPPVTWICGKNTRRKNNVKVEGFYSRGRPRLSFLDQMDRVLSESEESIVSENGVHKGTGNEN